VDGSLLYVRQKGFGVRAINLTQDGAKGVDISTIADHFFSGAPSDFRHGNFEGTSRHIVSWAYAEDPFGIIWAVRADGVLLSLTFSAEANQWAWTEHDVGAKVWDVCTIPESDEDGVYLLVQRDLSRNNLGQPSGKLSIERMTSRVFRGSTDEGIALDCATRFYGAPTRTFTGLPLKDGDEAWAVCPGNSPIGPMTVSNHSVTLPRMPTPTMPGVSGRNSVDPIQVTWIGKRFSFELETLDIAAGEVRTKQKTVKSVAFEVTDARGLHAGQSWDALSEYRADTMSPPSTPSAANSLVVVPVSGGWDAHARACLRQSLPVPVTVLGITREVDVGG
jgi:hypothetical protein